MPDFEQIDKKIDDLTKLFTDFKTQYETDMRGDKKLSNGEKGIVNEIRAMKKYHDDYPSYLWLLKNKPLPTIATTLGIGLGIYFIGMAIFLTFGPTALVEAFLQLLGFPTL